MPHPIREILAASAIVAFAVIAFAILWATGRKSATSSAPALAAPREMQLVMLIEAAMLGYSLARKGERAR